MTRCWKWVCIVSLAIGLFGCRSNRPRLGSPGSLEQQRLDATVFDPYADTEMGPEVVGNRPRDFQQPLSDSDRSRLFRSRWIPF